MERRKYPRVPVQWLMSFCAGPISSKGRVSGTGTVKNLSEGVVRWSAEHEFGLEFIEVWPEERARLQRFVTTACDDPVTETPAPPRHYVTKQPV